MSAPAKTVTILEDITVQFTERGYAGFHQVDFKAGDTVEGRVQGLGLNPKQAAEKIRVTTPKGHYIFPVRAVSY